MLKRITIVGSLFALFIGLYFLYENVTGDFRSVNITYDLPYHPEWEITLDDTQKEKIDTILSEPFSFLGHGHQTFAFLSKDGKYVLKIFKFKRLKESSFLNFLLEVPLFQDYAKKQERIRKNRFDKLFKGYLIAFNYDQKNTGISYIHLNLTKDIKKSVTVTDYFGFTHVLNLDDIVFAIQEKAIPTKKVFQALLNQGDVEEVKKHLLALFTMYVDEYHHAIIDKDRNILSNTGFIEDRAVRIDIGQLSIDPSIKSTQAMKEDLQKIAHERLYKWFLSHYPQYANDLKTMMDETINSSMLN